jgi:hypothetical protein
MLLERSRTRIHAQLTRTVHYRSGANGDAKLARPELPLGVTSGSDNTNPACHCHTLLVGEEGLTTSRCGAASLAPDMQPLTTAHIRGFRSHGTLAAA